MSRLLSPSDSDGVVPECLALQLGSRASTHKLFFGPDLELHWRCVPENYIYQTSDPNRMKLIIIIGLYCIYLPSLLS